MSKRFQNLPKSVIRAEISRNCYSWQTCKNRRKWVVCQRARNTHTHTHRGRDRKRERARSELWSELLGTDWRRGPCCRLHTSLQPHPTFYEKGQQLQSIHRGECDSLIRLNVLLFLPPKRWMSSPCPTEGARCERILWQRFVNKLRVRQRFSVCRRCESIWMAVIWIVLE